MNNDVVLSLVAVGLVAVTAWRKIRAPPAAAATPPAAAEVPALPRLVLAWQEEQREQQRRTEECLRAIKGLIEQASQLPPKP